MLDCGSLDINGNNQFLFTECDYTGIDIGPGKNVDLGSLIHEFDYKFYNGGKPYDTVICTEALEHDPFWKESIRHMFEMLRPRGLWLMTCATDRRVVHGTTGCAPDSSPLTIADGRFDDYYHNLTIEEILQEFDLDDIFWRWECEIARDNQDLYIWGIKRE